jgi:hypothetical protein
LLIYILFIFNSYYFKSDDGIQLSLSELETLKCVMNVSDNKAESVVSELITHISYILCYPFAIDASEDIVSRSYMLIKEFNLFSKLLDACVAYCGGNTCCEVPVSLLVRLILGDEDLARMLVDRLNESSDVCDFFTAILHKPNSAETVVADLFAMLSHLCRRGDDAIAPAMRILKRSTSEQSDSIGDYQIIVKYLLNGNPLLKSKCCNMIGNMMRHNDAFYVAMRENKDLIDCLLKCCQLDELNVRKV